MHDSSMKTFIHGCMIATANKEHTHETCMHSYGLLSPGFNKKGPRGGDVQVGHSNTYMHAFMYHFAFIMGFHACMHFFDFRPSRKRSLTAGELKENLIEEIKELYKEINPGKKDVPELLAYYEGHELDLYKRICEKYNVEPKKRFGSILSRRSRRRSRSESPALPMASKPNAPAPPDADAGAGGGKAHAEPERGKAGAEPEGGKAAGAELEGGKAADASKVSASRQVSPDAAKTECWNNPSLPSSSPDGEILAMPSTPQVLGPNPESPKEDGFQGCSSSTTTQASCCTCPVVATTSPSSSRCQTFGDNCTSSPTSCQEGKAQQSATGQNHSCFHAFMHAIHVIHQSHAQVM